MSTNVGLSQCPDHDVVLQDIADYVPDYCIDSAGALDTARNCLMDTLGCGLLMLRFLEYTKHLGPLVKGTLAPHGARAPGTSFRLDPVKAVWDTGCIVCQLDYSDTWLVAEWGHPSDNLGNILAVADHLSQKRLANGEAPLNMCQVLEAMIMAHETQGVIALENLFNRVNLDHVLLVKVVSTAVCAKPMGADHEQLLAALSHVFVDGQVPRTYRYAPDASSRKSWAAGDVTSHGVCLADIALCGKVGIPGMLGVSQWGFYDVLFSHTNKDLATKPEDKWCFSFPRGYGSYVMESVLFKVSFPTEFHVQTAAEAAVRLHPLVKGRLRRVSRIVIAARESAIRIISKVGPLTNPADRNHCLQYMTVVPLILDDLAAEYCEDAFHAARPLIDRLRERMEIVEESCCSREYLEADKRFIADVVEVFFDDGSSIGQVAVRYPLGHRRRRAEGIPLPQEKSKANLAMRFPPQRCQRIFDPCNHQASLEAAPMNRFMGLLAI